MTFKTPFTQTLLTVAIALALAPGTNYAAPKLSDIQGLPQTGSVTSIRSGKAGNGNTVITWLSDSNVYAQRILNTGTLDDGSLMFATDATAGAGLAVNADGSFVSVWPTSSEVMAVKVTGANLGTPFSVVSEALDKPVQVFSQAPGFDIAWDSSLLNVDADDLPGDAESIDLFDSIAMDSNGDFVVVTKNYNALTVTKNNDQSIDIPAGSNINSYDFDDESSKNKNKSVTFEITEPVIATNSSGDFVVVWEETKTETTRKNKPICTTYEGYKSCEDNLTYSSNATTNLIARRYNNLMVPKDTKPLVIASIKGPGTFIASPNVAFDADGDFTVAYTSGKSTYTAPKSEDAEGITTVESDVSVRQFTINKAKKLVAGTAIKVSAKPKLAAKHTLKNSTNQEPSVVVIDESKNSFIISWHNDYEDHYKDYENTESVCAKYKTTTDEYGYSYKECVSYKEVPTDASDSLSILKAKRYSK